MMFFGREKENHLLEQSYHASKSEIFVIYGRRRIGKSRLLKEFAQSKNSLFFEGLENTKTPGQLNHFFNSLKKQVKDPLLSQSPFKTWDEAFTYLTERVLTHKRKTILVLDELQWMAARQTKLVSLLKWFWDNNWKEKKVMLILCGSISSYMVDKVIKSKALYGRLSYQLHLKALTPREAAMMFTHKRSQEEIFKYLLVFGGVPKYLEEINLNQSFNQNMNRLCFNPTGSMYDEFEKIFYSQFREPQVYLTICNLLKDKILSISEISQKIKLGNGGGINRYLKNLEEAGFIKSYYPFGAPDKLKFRRFKLVDEFICFYFKYIRPNKNVIDQSPSERLFELVTKDGFDIWMGFAFERYCLKHAAFLADIMGFGNMMLQALPYYGLNDTRFQIDLIYERSDKVITVCEMKYTEKEVDPSVIAQVEKKCHQLKIPRGYSLERALITTAPPSPIIKDSEYFHHIITLDEFLG